MGTGYRTGPTIGLRCTCAILWRSLTIEETLPLFSSCGGVCSESHKGLIPSSGASYFPEYVCRSSGLPQAAIDCECGQRLHSGREWCQWLSSWWRAQTPSRYIRLIRTVWLLCMVCVYKLVYCCLFLVCVCLSFCGAPHDSEWNLWTPKFDLYPGLQVRAGDISTSNYPVSLHCSIFCMYTYLLHPELEPVFSVVLMLVRLNIK